MFYGERRSSVTLNYKTAMFISNFIGFLLLFINDHIAIQKKKNSEELPDFNARTYINYHVYYFTVIWSLGD